LRYSVLSVSIPWRSLWEIKHLCPWVDHVKLC
jgi:hypothetical protein